MRLFRKRIVYFFSIFVIVIVASYFRLSYIDLVEYKADEAINVFLSSRPLFGHEMPPGGTVSSVGILNFPLMNYLLFPIVLFTLNGMYISFVIAVVNVISIAAFFLMFKRYHGFLTALFSTFLLSIAPWAIFFSRKIWIQDFIVPLLVPFLYSFYKIKTDKNPSYWLLYAFSFMLLFQIHQTLLFFLVPFTLLMLSSKGRFVFFPALIGLLLGSVPLIPYILFELQNGCPDCSIIFHSSKSLDVSRDFLLFFRPLQISGIGDLFFLMGDDIAEFAQRYHLAFSSRKVFYLQYIFVPVSIVIFWLRNSKYRIFVYSALLVPTLYFVFRIHPKIHYFIVLLPFLFLFVGDSTSYLFKKNFFFKFTIIFLLICFFAASVLFHKSFFSFVGVRGSLSGDYGDTYKNYQKNIENKFQDYLSNPDLEEMILSYSVPETTFIGTSQFPLMLFDYVSVKNEISALEKQYKKVPVDRRAFNKLIAYYTREINSETLMVLRDKRKQYPFYGRIYNMTFDRYLKSNWLRYHRVEGFYIDAPRHWKVSTEDELITVFGDKLKIEINFSKTNGYLEAEGVFENYSPHLNVLGNKAERRLCVGDGFICGVEFDPILYKKKVIRITYLPIDSITRKEFESSVQTLDAVVSSLRIEK